MTHDDLKSWPFVEARKVLERVADKDIITSQQVMARRDCHILAHLAK